MPEGLAWVTAGQAERDPVEVLTNPATDLEVDLQARFVEETISNPSLPLRVGIRLDAGEAMPFEVWHTRSTAQ